MVDLELLAEKPDPFYKEAMASSYSRKSHQGGEAWFDNADLGQYVRTDSAGDHLEHVLADLVGPGAITRIWSANPAGIIKFYFDGEKEPRIQTPLIDLFSGNTAPFSPEFAYTSGTGKNLYFPIPYSKSLKVTLQETNQPVSLYYEINYRTYDSAIDVESFDIKNSGHWLAARDLVSKKLYDPNTVSVPKDSEWVHEVLTIKPGQTISIPKILGEKAVYEWSTQVLGLEEKGPWENPKRAHQALRFLNLLVSFDDEKSIQTPLGDFFGSSPGINPYQNLFFTVEPSVKMTSRLLMPFKKSMELSLTNHGKIPYTVDVNLRVATRTFKESNYFLRAQWKSVTKNTWPPFDTTILKTSGEGKIIGTSYGIANPVLIWWGEGDQKIFIDGESFPSTFGSGTEDDYGFAYGYNRPFTRPYHAQTRVDGPASGGHISLNRWYVLDAYPFSSRVQFDQEIWHWMPTTPTWTHVVYWYAKPGTALPQDIEVSTLAPRNFGKRENMLEPMDAEALKYEKTGGIAETQRLANCLRAEHLLWHHSQPGDKLTIHIPVSEAGRYSMILNLTMAPDYGRHKFYVNGKPTSQSFDSYWPSLYWKQPDLGTFPLKKGDNTLTVETLEKNTKAIPGNFFGADYIFLVKQ